MLGDLNKIATPENRISTEEDRKTQAGPDTGLMCLVMLLKFLGKAAEPEQIRHQRGKGNVPFDSDDILQACKQVEVKARAKNVSWKKLSKMPLPAIGRDKDGRFFIIAKIASNDNPSSPEASSESREGGGREAEKSSDETEDRDGLKQDQVAARAGAREAKRQRPATEGKTKNDSSPHQTKEGGGREAGGSSSSELESGSSPHETKESQKILIQSPLSEKPQILTEEVFLDLWSGDVILMTTRAMLAGAARKFDVTWFIPAIVKYRKILYEILLASFFLQLFALMTPMFFQVVIDKVLVHKGLTTLDVMILALIVVSIFEVVVGGLRTYVFSHTTNRVDVELGSKLFRHLLALPLSYFESRRVGDSVARVRELDTIREFLTSSSVTLVIDILFTFVFLAVMYLYSPTLLVIVLISLPCYVLVSVVITPILRKRLEDKFQRGARNQAFLVESVTGVQTLKAMAVEPQMQRKWEENLAGYVHSGFKAAMLGNIGSQSVQFINKVTTAVTLFWGATLVIEGAITVGQLVAFNMLAGRVSGPVLRLAQLWQDFQQARISVERLGDILNSPTEPTYNPNRTTLPDIKGRVEFDGVTFRYRADGAEVLRRVSLVIPEGQVVGIVGPSGSGKSTLTKLIQRLYVPESGRVLVDGVDLAMVDPAWLRRQVGVVLQENLLFNKTVRENIALADPTIAMERVIAAAKMAGAHDFILEQSEGYDTFIDERGANLSGGQRQRIAIARALITNPRILILDEATSALDAESEEIIQENLKSIAKGRTVIIIAHRLSAIKQASRILTVERGEITEDGTHVELMKHNGRYADLYRRQMRAASAEEGA